MKKCSTCKEEKDELFFTKDKRMNDGLRSQCKDCHNKTTNAWRSKNREKMREKSKEHYERNRDYYLEKSKVSWRSLSKEDRDKRKEYNKKYYILNKEKHLSSQRIKRQQRTEDDLNRDYLKQREYYEKNKETIKSYAKERYNNLSQKQKNKNTERNKNWRLSNREKTKAWSAVGNAILLGKIEKPIYCELCGAFDVKIHAHHEDYSKPLEVLWLCHDCHMFLHSDNRLNNIDKLKEIQNESN